VQDVMVLLDLIGSADTKFVNWFPKTQPLYDRLKNIGTCLIYEWFVRWVAVSSLILIKHWQPGQVTHLTQKRQWYHQVRKVM